MNRKLKIPLLTALALLLGFCLPAQEELRPLGANMQLMNVSAKNTQAARTTSVTGLDTIPFFEDFSYSPVSPYPSVNHWIDSNVFINHGFPIAPLSIGVATFDGLNKKGYPYNFNALATSSAQADKLTSRQINLQKHIINYAPSDSIYLSFYYQAKGRGDAPEANDSLSVDFYKPNQKKWVKVWGRKGYTPPTADSLFHLVMLPIKDTAYFDSLFQFRFRNRGAISGSFDQWHVDYIYIDKNRSKADSVAMLEDAAFEYMSTSILKNYSAMPYRQFIPSELATNFRSYQRNNYNTTKYGDYRYDVYRNGSIVNTYSTTPNNIDPFSVVGTNTVAAHTRPAIGLSIPTLTDSATYVIKHRFIASPDIHPKNDTITQYQKFSTYYAYDDGTAEAGYYLNVYGAKKALRYTINVADTLRAMRIYFDPLKEGPIITGSTFRMMIWADGGNGPGNLIYKDSLMNPQYLQGNYNMMPTYKLTSCQLISPGTYYFGIQQTTNQGLNVGIDMNNDHSNAMYYDVGSGWTQSAIKGSLMINPMLGCYYPPVPVGILEYQNRTTDRISLYPNPAQNSIRIGTNGVMVENGKLSILSSVGQTVQTGSFNSSDEIDISSLPNGIYFVYLSCEELSTSPQKLIIAR